jgi:hypothetical protein
VAIKLTTRKKDRKPVTVELDGREMRWVPQKLAGNLISFSDDDEDDEEETGDETRRMLDWFAAGLDPESGDEDWLVGRLRDNDDDFDLRDLGRLVKAAAKVASGRPT